MSNVSVESEREARIAAIEAKDLVEASASGVISVLDKVDHDWLFAELRASLTREAEARDEIEDLKNSVDIAEGDATLMNALHADAVKALAEARKDAERWLWIRERLHIVGRILSVNGVSTSESAMSVSDFDRIVDGARARPSTEEQET